MRISDLTRATKHTLSVATKGATKQKCNVLCDAIQNLSALHSLHVRGSMFPTSDGSGTLEWLHVVSSPPLLRTLKLYGYLGEVPVWFGSLMHLVKLHLEDNQLTEEGKPMEILGALPNLMLFSLGWNSYIGEILVFRTGAFPNLKKLFIFRASLHDCLREANFEDGTSPRMEMIEISNALLKSGIIGINCLPRLKEISLGYGGKVANLAVLKGGRTPQQSHVKTEGELQPP
jgi:disease resistance protein RPM1